MELPELPEPVGYADKGALAWSKRPGRQFPAPVVSQEDAHLADDPFLDADVSIFTADQMRAYGEQCILMERERCAKACEGQFAKGNPTVDEWDAGLNTGVLSCIAAIRSTSEPA